MNLDITKKYPVKQEVSDFTITWDNHLHYKDENPFYINEGPYREVESHGTTIDGSFRLTNGRTIHVHKDVGN